MRQADTVLHTLNTIKLVKQNRRIYIYIYVYNIFLSHQVTFSDGSASRNNAAV